MCILTNIVLLCFATLPVHGSKVEESAIRRLLKQKNERNILTVRSSLDNKVDELGLYVSHIYSSLNLLERGIYDTMELSNEVLDKDKKYRTESASMEGSGLVNDELCQIFCRFGNDHENIWRKNWSGRIMNVSECEITFDLYMILNIIRRVFALCNTMFKTLNEHSAAGTSASDLRKLILKHLSELSSNIYQLTRNKLFIELDCIVVIDSQLYEHLKKLCYRWSLMWEKENERNISERSSRMYIYCQNMMKSNTIHSSQANESASGMVKTKISSRLWSNDLFLHACLVLF